MAAVEVIEPVWAGARCIIAATGPSLTEEVVDLCRRAHDAGTHRIVAVNDAYRLLPVADVLYACDTAWWNAHNGCPEFAGERWSCHGVSTEKGQPENDKMPVANRYGLRLCGGRLDVGFSRNPGHVHYGNLSGFQAINFAILRGVIEGLLVGFDMHDRNGRHFFGPHPRPLSNAFNFERNVSVFNDAARSMPPGVEIKNCTPGSAIKCFGEYDLATELGLSDVVHSFPRAAAQAQAVP